MSRYSKKWSSLKIVSETPELLILKTHHGHSVCVGLILTIAVLLGVGTLLLGIVIVYLAFTTELQMLFQVLWMILFGTCAICLGGIVPAVVLKHFATSQTWTFDRHERTLYQVRKSFYRTYISNYPLADIVRVYVNQRDQGSDASYRIGFKVRPKTLPKFLDRSPHARPRNPNGRVHSSLFIWLTGIHSSREILVN